MGGGRQPHPPRGRESHDFEQRSGWWHAEALESPQNGECGLAVLVAAVAHFVYLWPKAESTSHSTGTGRPKQHSGSLKRPKPLE